MAFTPVSAIFLLRKLFIVKSFETIGGFRLVCLFEKLMY
jgi:hypothetical protein